MLAGVKALGPPARIPGRTPTTEVWGAAAPLWANLLLQLELSASMRTVQWAVVPTQGGSYPEYYNQVGTASLHAKGFASVWAIPGLCTVTDLLRLKSWLVTLRHLRCPGAPPASGFWLDLSAAAMPPGSAASALHTAVGAGDWRAALSMCLYGGASPPMPQMAEALLDVRMVHDPLHTAVASMISAVPPLWVAAARDMLGPGLQPLQRDPAGERVAAIEILKLLGWTLPCLVAPAGWERGRPGLRRRATVPQAPHLGIEAAVGVEQ